MRFSPHLLDEIRARLPVSQVVGRKVALKRKGREYAGLSPFKMEKTPSFFVNDQKGFYHCFASGEHGDIFKFLMTTEGLSFPEAVERLAEEAGVALPKAEFEDKERADERTRLLALMEEAAKFFEAALGGASGTEARRYIEKRGLKRETLATFRIGYAPNSRSALKEHLAKAGYTLEEMTLSGMLIAGDDIPVAYDRFRHRVMFPIGDAKGRIVAFGGRALDPEQNAKYLNSPETPLFHKGHLLFNAHRARAAAHDKDRVVAVEGYMDVISLAEAGFEEAVAPLGTALTEDQLKLLWRMSAEPILCFDGDSAGKRAAFRAVDTALPHLKPGASVMFAFLPDGLDPDDLVRQQGPAALESILRNSRPLVDVLWDRELGASAWGTPERRAAFEKRLEELLKQISDSSVQTHYRREFRNRLWKLWRDKATPKRSPYRTAHPVNCLSDDQLLLGLVVNPWLIDCYFDELIKHEFMDEVRASLFGFLIDLYAQSEGLTGADVELRLKNSMHATFADRLRKGAHVRGPFTQASNESDAVRYAFAEFLQRLRLDDLRREHELVASELQMALSEDSFHRLQLVQDEIRALEEATTRKSSGGIPEVDYDAYVQGLMRVKGVAS